MKPSLTDPRAKAVVAAVLLIVFGAAAGITADRLLTGRAPAPAGAEPLTLTALSEALDLDAAQQTRVGEVLDSLEAEIAAAASRGADSLREVARTASRRLEESLPSDRRSGFRTWMQQHGQRMMRDMWRGMGAMEDDGMMEMESGRGRMRERWWDEDEMGREGGRREMEGGRIMMRDMGGMRERRMEGPMGASLPPAIDSAELPEPESRGAVLFTRYCASCHALPDPAAHTASEWPAVVERMRGNMSVAAAPAPDDAEAGEVIRYLQAHGR